MRDIDVVVQRTNGSYRAIVPSLPYVTAEGKSREEVLANVRKAAEDFLATADLATISVNIPPDTVLSRSPSIALEVEQAAQGYPFAENWLRAAKLPKQDPQDELYQEYLAELAAEKQRQREEAECEAEHA